MSHGLCIQDVMNVAKSINKKVTKSQAKSILKEYPLAQLSDPSGSWNLVIEDLIYNVLSKDEGNKTYARKCSITGKGMNEGWIVEDHDMYFSKQKDAKAYVKSCGYKSLKKAFKDDFIYWTEWYQDEPQYVENNGVLFDL